MNSKTNAELADAIDAIAKRFSEGWHEGIEIDATDIADLCEAADEIERLRGLLLETYDAVMAASTYDGPRWLPVRKRIDAELQK